MIPRVVLSSLCVLLTACWEIPPRLPEPASLPHAPRAVWVPEPFAAPNRLHHRLFGELSAGRRIVVDPARPLPPRERLAALGAVDHAELLALIEAAAGTSPPNVQAAAVMQSDLLAAASLLASVGGTDESRRISGALVRLALDLATHLPASPPAGEPPVGLPSVGGEGAWEPTHEPLPASLLPRPEDLRWTRVLASADPVPGAAPGGATRRLLVLRLRVGLGPGGDARLLAIASECSIVRSGDDSVVLRAWHRDREAMLRGEEGWREIAPERASYGREPIAGAATLADQQRLAADVLDPLRAAAPTAR